MKIKILYEENIKNGHRNYITLEIPDGDYSLILERDYNQRLTEAPKSKKAEVKRCETLQELYDIFNKQEYNNWHRENRHRGIIKVPYIDDEKDEDENDGIEYLADNSDEEKRNYRYEYDALCQKIRTVLSPEYADILIAAALDDITIEEYSKQHNLKKDTVYKRLQRAKKKYLKFL